MYEEAIESLHADLEAMEDENAQIRKLIAHDRGNKYCGRMANEDTSALLTLLCFY